MTFFDMMRQGRIPYKSDFYVIEDYVSNTNQQGSMEPAIQLVTPTQQQVQQAKLQLMRNLSARVSKPRTQKLPAVVRSQGKKRPTVGSKVNPVTRQAVKQTVKKSTKPLVKRGVKRLATNTPKSRSKMNKIEYKF